MIKNNISFKYLNKKFTYNPESGLLTYKTGPVNYVGRIAGHLHKNGYVLITHRKKKIGAHRICFAIYHGLDLKEIPVIDHINGIPSDNRIINLRRSTIQENQLNNTKRRAGAILGVRQLKNGKWITTRPKWFNGVNFGKRKHIGVYETQEQAVLALNLSLKKASEGGE